MTVPAEAGADASSAAPAATPTPARPPRRARIRRAPADLPFTFADAALAAALGERRGEPDWLREDRAAAAADFARLPVESNRAVHAVRGLPRRRPGRRAAVPAGGRRSAAAGSDTSVPDGAAGVIELRDDAVDAPRARAGRCARAGSSSRRWARRWRATRPGSATRSWRRRFPATRSWPPCRAASGARASTSTSRTGSSWTARSSCAGSPGRQGRALLARTIIRLGVDASASVIEDQVAPDPARTGRPASLASRAWSAPPREIHLGAGAALSFASIQDLPRTTTLLHQRAATLGAGPRSSWALAQLGGRIVRSRIDNRLLGRRELGRAGRDRVRRDRPAVRPHLVHAPRRRRTRPATCSARRSSSRAAAPTSRA